MKITEIANEYATEIGNSLECYGESSLFFSDTESTISANENGKNAFSEIQTLLGTFKETLEADKENIITLKASYDYFDFKVGEKNKGQ